MQEIVLEWSPTLDKGTAARRSESEDDNYPEADDMAPVDRDLEKSVALLARDVHAIGYRVNMFYQALLIGVVVFVVTTALRWLGIQS